MSDRTKKKPHTAGTGTASKTTSDACNHTGNDPLVGWFGLGSGVKPSRLERKTKRTWKRGEK